MEKYTKPCVEKLKTQSSDIALKKANCSGSNSRKMPVGNFTKK